MTHEELVALRHAFHLDPEVGFNEHRTKVRVAAILRDLGLEVHEALASSVS
jgi:metal-dependent amidase/aminoacylase/carboxypeptidase family protein